MLSQSQLAMLRKEALVVIGCNISSSPRLIDVLLSLDVHVVQKVMWAGTQGLESVQDAFKQPQESR